MGTRIGRTGRTKTPVPQCIPASPMAVQLGVFVQHIAEIPTEQRQLPDLRGVDWKYVFWCWSTLRNDYAKHVCGQVNQLSCDQFRVCLNTVDHAVRRMAHFRNERGLDPLPRATLPC
jgi:hypothetical protein